MAKEFKIILTGLMALFFFGFANAMPDTTMIPVYRQYFHDKINNEQKLCDRADGKLDNMMRVCNNVDINLRVTDILFRKIDELQDWVESNKNIETCIQIWEALTDRNRIAIIQTILEKKRNQSKRISIIGRKFYSHSDGTGK